jgi:hypothetical protein
MRENTPSPLSNVIIIRRRLDQEPPRPDRARQRGGDVERLAER